MGTPNAHEIATAAIERTRREHKNRSSARLAGAALEALAAARFAVVQLPEPDDTEGLDTTWNVGNITVKRLGTEVLWPTGYTKTPDVHTHNGCSPEWAEKLAVAILAAAASLPTTNKGV